MDHRSEASAKSEIRRRDLSNLSTSRDVKSRYDED
jgi:hypothetical protein